MFQKNSPKPGLQREGGVLASVQKVGGKLRDSLFGKHTVLPPPIPCTEIKQALECDSTDIHKSPLSETQRHGTIVFTITENTGYYQSEGA